ncbi:hypothetical protein K501DRAFT_273232 [Backusella circina FSU 941]|nr:hypothetical protein K501DRAFT_273232 [Backusella circina FSU 941]
MSLFRLLFVLVIGPSGKEKITTIWPSFNHKQKFLKETRNKLRFKVSICYEFVLRQIVYITELYLVLMVLRGKKQSTHSTWFYRLYFQGLVFTHMNLTSKAM